MWTDFVAVKWNFGRWLEISALSMERVRSCMVRESNRVKLNFGAGDQRSVDGARKKVHGTRIQQSQIVKARHV
jgi:hypothetical protein